MVTSSMTLTNPLVALPILTGSVKDAETCKKICKAMLTAYKATAHYGPDEPIVGLLGSALEKLGVEDKEDFVKNCCVTIMRDIYLNFHIGTDDLPYETQIAIVAHECEHVAQGRKDGVAVFFMRYYTSKAHRAEYEAQALAINLEVLYRLTGKMPDLRKMAEKLLWYKCSATDVVVVEKHLAIISNTLLKGGVISDQMRIITRAIMAKAG